MSEESEQTTHGTVRLFVWLTALLATYVLSVGPVAWLCFNFSAPGPVLAVVNTLYLPVWWLCEQNVWTTALYIQYMNLWVEVGP